MKTKKNFHIKATFIGTSSLGYEKNEEYDLHIFHTTKGIKIERFDIKGKGLKWYITFRDFLSDWNNIVNIE